MSHQLQTMRETQNCDCCDIYCADENTEKKLLASTELQPHAIKRFKSKVNHMLFVKQHPTRHLRATAPRTHLGGAWKQLFYILISHITTILRDVVRYRSM